MQAHIWADAEALAVERHWGDIRPPPCHLLQVVGIVEAATGRKGNRHDATLELDNLTHNGGEIRFLQPHPHVCEVETLDELHKDVLRPRHVVRRGRVCVHFRHGQALGTEEAHRGNLAGNGVEPGDCDGVRDASDQLELVVHSDEENAVKSALVELHQSLDILGRATDRLRGKSAKLVDVELEPALCETQFVIHTEMCKNHAIRDM